jgi:hypothetical protein
VPEGHPSPLPFPPDGVVNFIPLPVVLVIEMVSETFIREKSKVGIVNIEEVRFPIVLLPVENFSPPEKLEVPKNTSSPAEKISVVVRVKM